MTKKEKVTVVLHDNEIVGVFRGGITRAMDMIEKDAKVQAKENEDDYILDLIEEYTYEEGYLE